MAELTKIDAGFATIGQGAGPMMVTWKAGLFQKHGLDIERQRIMGGAKGIVRGLMSGDIQFGNMAAPAPLRANLKGEADVIFLTGGINQIEISGTDPAGNATAASLSLAALTSSSFWAGPALTTGRIWPGRKSALSATGGSTMLW